MIVRGYIAKLSGIRVIKMVSSDRRPRLSVVMRRRENPFLIRYLPIGAFYHGVLF
jgi:hypothetical protein